MTNTDIYFERAKRFQDDRAAILNEYNQRMAQLEPHKGSAYYRDEAKAAQDKKAAAMAALDGKPLLDAITLMMKANERRPATAPTEEQLRLLQVLKMRDTITETELAEAANSCRGCGAALSVIQEMAGKNGIMKNFLYDDSGETMNSAAAADRVKNLWGLTKDFIQYETTQATRAAQRFHERRYGNGGSTPMQTRPVFTTKQECFEQLAGMDAATLRGFAAAVDGE